MRKPVRQTLKLSAEYVYTDGRCTKIGVEVLEIVGGTV
nr:MAG TPA: hypothetical protein [Crassvirales sp.]